MRYVEIYLMGGCRIWQFLNSEEQENEVRGFLEKYLNAIPAPNERVVIGIGGHKFLHDRFIGYTIAEWQESESVKAQKEAVETMKQMVACEKCGDEWREGE